MGWERTQLTPGDQRNIPEHVAPCLAYKAGRRWRKGRMLRVMALVFLSHCDAAWLSWRWLNTSLTMKSRELTPCFALLCWHAQFLLYLINCFHLNPPYFITSTIQIPSLHSTVVASEKLLGLRCWLWLNHDPYNSLVLFLTFFLSTTNPYKSGAILLNKYKYCVIKPV